MSDQTQNPNQHGGGQQNQQNGGRTNADKLSEMLKFDPARRVPLAGKAFARVVNEIKKEKLAAAKTQAKDLLLKAMDLSKQKADAKKKFEQQDKKFEKELGKILKQIDNLLQGRALEHGVKNDQNNGGNKEEEEEEATA